MIYCGVGKEIIAHFLGPCPLPPLRGLVRFVPPAESYVVVVGDNALLALVAHQPYLPAELLCHLAGIASLTKERVDGAHFGPALLQRDLGKVGGRLA